jgi:hypothetical protein
MQDIQRFTPAVLQLQQGSCCGKALDLQWAPTAACPKVKSIENCGHVILDSELETIRVATHGDKRILSTACEVVFDQFRIAVLDCGPNAGLQGHEQVAPIAHLGFRGPIGSPEQIAMFFGLEGYVLQLRQVGELLAVSEKEPLRVGAGMRQSPISFLLITLLKVAKR